ncbi:MAG: translocation/assembly module TamB, partial [Pedobacter sp.]
TQIDISGTAKGLPDINKTFLDLNIKKLYVTKSDILVAVPKKSLPPSIELPNVINAKGNFKGSMTDFNTNLNIQTDMGGAILVAAMKGAKGKESYKADINLNNFNVGRLLKMQPKLGRVSVKANVEGTGLDPKKINAKFNAKVLSAYYNKYTYRNLNVAGTYANQNVSIKSSMPDSNANFALDAKVSLAGKYPSVKADLNLKQVNLQALNFSPTVLSAAGIVKVDLKTADADYLNGTVDITGLQVVKDAQKIDVDTISVFAKTTETTNELTLKSEILSAKIDGKYQLTKVSNAIINEINKYYAFGEVTKIPDQRLRFVVQIYDSKLLKQFVPELTVFKPSQFYGLIDTQKDSLQIKGNFPQIVYGDFKVDTTVLNISNDNNKLAYGLTVKALQSPSIALFNTEISGDAANNLLGVNIFLRDRQRKDKYVIGGDFQSINKDFKFTLD